MPPPKPLLFLALLCLILSCRHNHAYTYAIKDFRKELQPCLIKLTQEGIVDLGKDSLKQLATDAELTNLSRSEHPVLRASAFLEMFKRSSFNHFEIMMEHLDDAAMVLVDRGEFGTAFMTVSDYILDRATWTSAEARMKTVDALLTRYNDLRSAYRIVKYIPAEEKYYRFIRQMAIENKNPGAYGLHRNFTDIEYVLFGLAKFRKKEDVTIIREILLSDVWNLSYISFELMKAFPDTAYMEVLELYHRRQFYKFTGKRRDGFTGYEPDKAEPEDFINALVVQQNARSAALLDTILTRLPLFTCIPDQEVIMNELVMAIWEHPCAAYAGLRNKVKTKATEILAGRFTIPVEPLNLGSDTTTITTRFILWYPW